MADRKLDEDYRRVLEASRRSGDVIAEGQGTERRRHPRLRVKPGALPAELDPWVFAIDISISGMAFYADEPVAEGETVTIHLGELAQAEVPQLEARQAELMTRIRQARSRKVLIPRAAALGLRLPADSEIVILQVPGPEKR